MTKYKPEWVEQAQNEGKHPFFITIPVIKEYHKQDITTILGLGTAVERSRTGHRMSQEFVDKLKQVSKGKHLFINHNPDQIAGKITGVKEGRPDEILPIAELLTPHDNPIVDAPRAKVEHWIKNKVQLGLSFGGTADKIKTTREENGNITYDVQDGELMEWSVTPINAVKRSDGSVKALDGGCPGGICQQIATQIEQGVNLPEIYDNDLLIDEESPEKEPKGESVEESSEIEQVKEEMEDINMSEDVKELKEMIEGQNKLIQTLIDDKQKRDELEQKALEEKEIQKRIDDALEEQSKTFKEATVELINEEFGKILKDKQGVTQKSEEGDKDVKKALEQDTKKKPEDVKFNDPVNYPAVLGGKVVQGKTPAELFTG